MARGQRKLARWAVLAAAGIAGPAVALGVAAAGADVPSGNIVRNPGAEEGPPGATDTTGASPDPAPPEWTLYHVSGITGQFEPGGQFTYVNYVNSDTSGDVPGPGIRDLIGGGRSFFSGGQNFEDVPFRAEQTISVSPAAPEVDAGRVTATLAAYLGGGGADDDQMSFEAAYLNAAGATLGTLKIGPVTAADRGNATGLLRRSGAGMVPGGTRSIRVRMTATEVGAGGYVHAYADNLSLTLLVAPPPTLGHLPKPVLGRLVNVKALSGQVYYKPPAGMGAASASARASVKKGKGFIPLTEPRQIPVGSLLDTRGGKLRLVSARNSAGKIQAGDFQGGIFQVLQSRRKRLKGLTTLRLKGGNFRRRCGTRRRKKKRRRVSSSQAAPLAESARRRRRTVRRLRGRTRRGRFRTRGRHSSATVRGTTWTVADRCDGTLTKVRRGKVLVRDFRRKKRIVVRQGKSYLARAPG